MQPLDENYPPEGHRAPSTSPPAIVEFSAYPEGGYGWVITGSKVQTQM